MKKMYFLVVYAALFSTLFSCSKKESDPSPTISSTRDFYFLATIDGKSVKYEGNTVQTSPSEYVSGGGFTGSSMTNGYAHRQFSTMSVVPRNKNNATVSIIKLFPTEPTLDEQRGMFVVKSFEYGKRETESQEWQEGATVEMMDEAGVVWASYLGAGSQSGSTFKITSVIDNSDVNTSYTFHKIVTYEFTCKLYDGKGNTKTLTNGKLRGRALARN